MDQEFGRANPELAEFITYDNNEYIGVEKPGTWGGPTQEQYDKIVAAIDNPGGKEEGIQVMVLPNGEVMVISPDGVTGSVPRDQLQAAIAAGYEIYKGGE